MTELQPLNSTLAKHWCANSIIPLLSRLPLLATMLLNIDLRWYGHYHSCQITQLRRWLKKNTKSTYTNPNYFNPNHFLNLFVGLFCKPAAPKLVRSEPSEQTSSSHILRFKSGPPPCQNQHPHSTITQASLFHWLVWHLSLWWWSCLIPLPPSPSSLLHFALAYTKLIVLILS